jgi:5-hydroxyisourate hydrolase
MSGPRSRITTHVLDATSGRPAAGIGATLERQVGTSWQEVTSGRTDADGRISDFGPEDLEAGVYRVTVAVGPYFTDLNQPTFYPEVVIPFVIDDPDAHYHVPLLLSPYAYSTYRGS